MLSFLITVCLMPTDGQQPYCAMSAKTEVQSTANVAECTAMTQDAADKILAGQMERLPTKRGLAVGKCVQQEGLSELISSARDYLLQGGFKVEVTYY